LRPRLRLLAALLLVGCGAVGTEAPPTPAPDAPGACPSMDEALQRTRESLREGALGELTPAAKQILVDDGGARVLIPGIRQLAEEVPVADMFKLTEGYSRGEGLARLKPHMLNVMDYVAGTSDFIDGEHYEPLDTMHRIATRCDVVDSLGAVRALLELEVTLPDGTRKDYLDALFDLFVRLAEDPNFSELLGSIEYTDEERPGEITIGQDAFRLIVVLLTENVASPDFELTTLRTLVNDLLLAQLDGPNPEQTEATVNELLDLLDLILDPDGDIFPQLQGLIGCLVEEDPNADIPAMLFDYMSIEELSLEELLADMDAMGEDAAGIALLDLAIDGTRALEQNRNLTRDMLGVLARFISPEISRTSVPATLRLQGKGVVGELLRFLELLTTGCGEGDP
jgi:hypothetical protein